MPSLIYNYGDWDFWAPYNPATTDYGNQSVTFDGENKIIIVNHGITSLDFREDVYSNWKEWTAARDNAKFPQAISVIGGDPLPGSRVLGTTFFMENGWRMRTWEGNHELTMTGNVFTKEGDPVFINTINPWTITIALNTSTLVEAIVPETSISAGDRSAIAQQVWAEPINGTETALDLLLDIPADVWNEIIDATRNQSARDKLKKIATKAQDIALK